MQICSSALRGEGGGLGKRRIAVFDEPSMPLCLTALSQSLHPLGHLTVMFRNTIKRTPCTSLGVVSLSECVLAGSSAGYDGRTAVLRQASVWVCRRNNEGADTYPAQSYEQLPAPHRWRHRRLQSIHGTGRYHVTAEIAILLGLSVGTNCCIGTGKTRWKYQISFYQNRNLIHVLIEIFSWCWIFRGFETLRGSIVVLSNRDTHKISHVWWILLRFTSTSNLETLDSELKIMAPQAL